MQATTAFLLVLAVIPCFCQRPFYAGLHPIGYPEPSNRLNAAKNLDKSLPPQLNGDAAYANRLDQLPADQQPFWYLNKKHYAEASKNPQTYPQRPSIFNENSG